MNDFTKGTILLNDHSVRRETKLMENEGYIFFYFIKVFIKDHYKIVQNNF